MRGFLLQKLETPLGYFVGHNDFHNPAILPGSVSVTIVSQGSRQRRAKEATAACSRLIFKPFDPFLPIMGEV